MGARIEGLLERRQARLEEKKKKLDKEEQGLVAPKKQPEKKTENAPDLERAENLNPAVKYGLREPLEPSKYGQITTIIRMKLAPETAPPQTKETLLLSSVENPAQPKTLFIQYKGRTTSIIVDQSIKIEDLEPQDRERAEILLAVWDEAERKARARGDQFFTDGLTREERMQLAIRICLTLRKKCEQYGVKTNFIFAIGLVESHWNPLAKSSAGARGSMQIMPKTGAGLGLKGPEAFYDLDLNLDAGIRYMVSSCRLAEVGVIAPFAYNGGPFRYQTIKDAAKTGDWDFRQSQDYGCRVSSIFWALETGDRETVMRDTFFPASRERVLEFVGDVAKGNIILWAMEDKIPEPAHDEDVASAPEGGGNAPKIIRGNRFCENLGGYINEII